MKAKLKIQTKWIKDDQAKHKREMHNPQSTDGERAIAYGLWLARRDGHDLPDDAANYATIVWGRVAGKKRAKAIKFFGRFAGVAFMFPHWDYIERGAVQLPDAPEGSPC